MIYKRKQLKYLLVTHSNSPLFQLVLDRIRGTKNTQLYNMAFILDDYYDQSFGIKQILKSIKVEDLDL